MNASSASVALVTDSSSQLTPDLARRLGTPLGPVRVVPVTVNINGVAYAEGQTIDADAFEAALSSDDGAPDVSTTQPTAATFLETFERCVDLGATEILAVLVGSELSGTLDAARLATQQLDVPIRLVDTGTASFGVSCCLWRASLTLSNGGSVEAASEAAAQMASMVQSVFVLDGIELARRSGRFDRAGLDTASLEGQPVLRSAPGVLDVLQTVADADAAIEVMLEVMCERGESVIVASGRASRDSWALSDGLESRLAEHPLVAELVRYRVGPSIAAHTGPGAAGAFWFPAAALSD